MSPPFSGFPNSALPLFNTLPPQSPGPQYSPGYYSQMAYQMAGRPLQGPYPSVATPPTMPGTGAVGSSASTGANALGVLGLLAKNPGLVKNGYNAISGLLGGGPPAASLADAQQGYLNAGNSGSQAPQGPLDSTQQAYLNAGQNGSGLLGAAAGAAPAAAGLLGGTAAPAGAVTISDMAGNVLAGGSAPAADAASVELSQAPEQIGGYQATADAGSGASGGVGYAGPVVAAFLGEQLAQGLLSGSGHYHPTGNDIEANTAAWLDSNGPGLAGINGTGMPDPQAVATWQKANPGVAFPMQNYSPMTVELKNGTSITGDQYQQLQNMNAQFLQSNNSTRGTHSAWSGLTADQSKQLNDYLTSIAKPSGPAATASPAQLAAIQQANAYSLDPGLLQQLQNGYAGLMGR